MQQQKARIINHQQIAEKYFKLTINSKEISENAQPGQFVSVRCSPGNCPLLRRPFAVHRRDQGKEIFEILYQVVGGGTKILSLSHKVGDEIDLIGPLGQGFKINPQKKISILVAGGIGVAPLTALADKLSEQKKSVYFIIGAKHRHSILCEEEIRESGAKVITTTEDGSAGKKGLASQALEELLDRKLAPSQLNTCEIFSCGPVGMLKAVAALSISKKTPAQISLDEKLACGVGACQGCSVRTKNGYKLVCKDGPVFPAEEILW